MDVCGHNESDVELNLRTLREKNQRIEKFFLFSCSVFSKICMKKVFVCKSLKEKTLKTIPSRNNCSYNKLYLL